MSKYKIDRLGEIVVGFELTIIASWCAAVILYSAFASIPWWLNRFIVVYIVLHLAVVLVAAFVLFILGGITLISNGVEGLTSQANESTNEDREGEI